MMILTICTMHIVQYLQKQIAVGIKELENWFY